MLGKLSYPLARSSISAISVATVLIVASNAVFAAQNQFSFTISPAQSHMVIALDGRELAVLPVEPRQYRALTNRHKQRFARRAMRWYHGCGGYAGHNGHRGYGHYGWHGYSPYGHYYRPAPAKLELTTGKELEMIALPGDVDPVTTAAPGEKPGPTLIDRWRATATGVASGPVDIVVSRRPEMEMMAEVQHGLNRLGYNSGRADGVIGPVTRAAVKRFQHANGLEADGVIGSATLNALHAALGPRAPKPAMVTIRRNGEIVRRFDVALHRPGEKLGDHVMLRERQTHRFESGWRMAALAQSARGSNAALVNPLSRAAGQPSNPLERLLMASEDTATLRRMSGAGSTLVITDHAVEDGGMQLAAR